MTLSTLPRLADQAVSARGGADLFRFALADRIPDTSFAKNADGSVTISGVDLLKTGTFNGLTLVDGDLLAMVDRFDMLAEAGIFLPPFRLDHSWSVLSVIGYFESLETYTRTDDTDGVSRTFLRGTIRLTGSVDFEPAALVNAIKRGALRSRSSEIGYYLTNGGVELPLVFYGCAFVDIPAVEGLSPVTLSKRPEPHKITNLTAVTPPEGTPMDPKKLARLAALRAFASLSVDQSTELVALEAEATEAGVTDEDVDGVPDEDVAAESGDAPAEETDEERTAREAAEATAAEEAAAAASASAGTVPPVAGDGDAAAELTAARAEIARLRAAEVTRSVAAFRAAGVLTDTNEGDATALLSHDDENVRRAAGALLGAIPAPVSLGTRRGRTALANAGTPGGAGELIRVGMSKDEVGPLWANLSSEERKTRQAEYDAWFAERKDSGARD